METLAKGEGWGLAVTCTGSGNGDGGCKSKLRVSKSDIYTTESHHYDGSHESYYTFSCPECQAETDIPSSKVPSQISRDLPNKKQWKILQPLSLDNDTGQPLEHKALMLLMCLGAAQSLASDLEDLLQSDILPTDIIDCAELLLAGNSSDDMKPLVPLFVEQLKE